MPYAAWLDELPHQARCVIRLQGPDTLRFLQGTVSADLAALQRLPLPRPAVAATLLTVKAKIVAEMVALVRSEEIIDVCVPAALAEEVATKFDRHIIMDDVEVSQRPDDALAVLWGAGATEIPPADGAELWPCSYPVAGVLCVGPRAAVAATLASCDAADGDAFHHHRIEEGIAAWGFEVAPDFFPPEVGLVQAVSYDKGCYLGQEPLARIHARGQVNRVMVRVSGSGGSGLTMAAGLAHPDRPEAGRLTTVVGDAGLAIVRRTFAEPGTMLSAGGVAVEVVSGALGDDPGIGSRRS